MRRESGGLSGRWAVKGFTSEQAIFGELSHFWSAAQFGKNAMENGIGKIQQKIGIQNEKQFTHFTDYSLLSYYVYYIIE